jgi:hypothetical protein
MSFCHFWRKESVLALGDSERQPCFVRDQRGLEVADVKSCLAINNLAVAGRVERNRCTNSSLFEVILDGFRDKVVKDASHNDQLRQMPGNAETGASCGNIEISQSSPGAAFESGAVAAETRALRRAGGDVGHGVV